MHVKTGGVILLHVSKGVCFMNLSKRKTIGRRIKELREGAGFSQDALAEKLNMKRANIANYEAGRALPPADVLLKLADIFNVTTDFLLGRDQPESKDFGYDDIGFAVREERLEQGLTQQQLASLIGVSQSEISQYERGLIPIPSDVAEKIADVFGMSLPAFLNKYNLWDEHIPFEFEGDVDKYLAFKKAEAEDAMRDPGYDIQTIAAHHDGEDWTPEELEEIEKFKEFVRMKRRPRENQGE